MLFMTIFRLPQKKFIFFKLLVCSIFCFVFLFAIGLKIPEFFTVKKASATIAESSKYLPLDPANKNININGYNIEMSGGWLTYDGDNEGIYIETNGDVGIGTTSPSYALDVAGYGQFAQPVTVGTPTADTHATTKSYVDSELAEATSTAENTYVNESGDTMTGALDMDSNDIQTIGNLTTSGDLGITGGNVGIGTTNPSTALEVNGIYETGLSNSYDKIRVYPSSSYTIGMKSAQTLGFLNDWATTFTMNTDNNRGWLWRDTSDAASDGAMSLTTNGRLYVKSTAAFSGDVGIGTTGPSYALDVAGYGQFSQPVTVGTPTAASHAATKDYVDSNSGTGLPTGTDGQTLYNSAGDWVSSSNLYHDGTNVGIGTNAPISPKYGSGGKTLDVRESDDGEIAQIYATGSGQGTGYIYVGQDNSYGGGITYNGDNTPSMPQSSDHISLFRRSGGTDYEVLHWTHNDSTAHFEGSATFPQPITVGTPTADTHATTKSYVDSELAEATSTAENTYVNESGDTMTGALDMDSNDIQTLGNLTTSGDLGITGGNVGIGTASPAYKLDVAANGTYAYVRDGTGVLARNYVNSYDWDVGGTGGTPMFPKNGATAENNREWGIGPHGNRAILWKATPDATSGGDGGWNGDYFSIDHTKTYRYSVWIKKTGSNDGTTYFGTHGGGAPVLNLDGTENTNPYFWSGDLPSLNKWYLLIGYVHGSGDSSTTHYGGIYDGETGKKVVSATDYKFQTTTTATNHRSYLYYSTAQDNNQYWWDPRVEEVTGFEPTIESLLGLYKGATQDADSYFGGNVGIGTTDPNDKLDINGALRFQDSDRRIYGTSSDGNDTVAIDGNWNELLVMGRVIGWTGSNFYIGSNWDTVDHTDDMIEIGHDVGHLEFEDTTGEVMRVTGGDVGIGTTNPNAPLDIAAPGSGETLLVGRDSGNPNIEANNDGSGHLIMDSIGGTYVSLNHYSGDDVALVNGGGNVGIGTTGPGAKLDVAGGGSFGNPVTVGTPTTASHAATKDYVDSSSGATDVQMMASAHDQATTDGCNCVADACGAGWTDIGNHGCEINNNCCYDDGCSNLDGKGEQTCNCTCNICRKD